MKNISNIIKNLINRIKRIAADSSKNERLKLKFGIIKARLLPRSNIFLRANGPILEHNIAYGWVKSKGTLIIFPKTEANPHIVISGMSGFGKSTLFKSLLLDIRNSGLSCIIFDAHNEHSEIVRALNGSVHNTLYSGINILDLDNASVSERISELSRLFKEVYSLGYIQTTKLSECLWYTYRKAGARARSDRDLRMTPSIKELLEELSIFINNSRTLSEKNTLLHLRDRLSLLNSSAFTNSVIKMESIEKGLHSFSLANMKSKEAQLIYIGELLNRIYSRMHDSSKNQELRLYIMIDEAQFLTDNSNNNSIIAKLIEEGRKYGIGVIIVTHAASTLNKKIISNSSTFISFYGREPSEISYITKILSGNNTAMIESVRNKISVIKQNEAIIVSSNIRNPILISTPKFDQANVRYNEELSESEILDLIKIRVKKPIRLDKLSEIEVHLKETGIRKLIAKSLIDYLSLELNGKKEEWIMFHNNSLSIEHEVWVKRISEMLDSKKISNIIIDNSNGPDIVVSSDGKRIAIEYETGSKSIESTRKMLNSRIKDYSKVIVVTNERSFEIYKTTFQYNNLEILKFDEIESSHFSFCLGLL